MFLIRKMREKKMAPLLEKEKKFYGKAKNIEANQLETFNELWIDIQKNVKYYKKLVEAKDLPNQFKTIEEFTKLPIMTRDYINEYMDEFTNTKNPIDSVGTTGGSTGNPLKFPKWNSETVDCEPSVWYVRDFYNIKRSDKMFRLWGHSHTLGTGVTRIKNKLKFDIGLPLVGFKRFSAYDLSDKKLKQAGNEILKFKPRYIVGYSKALYMLARANEDRKKEFHELGLKAVIGAAEGFERPEDREYVAEIFGCPAGMQYAAMETNYIAHTHPNGEYRALYKNNLIECVDEDGNPATTGRILITSLYPRAFPLIRYELGDIIEEAEKDGMSVLSFKDIKGRNNDFLMLDDDTPIHSEGITHAIKFSDDITAYQIRYTSNKVYTIYVKSNKQLIDEDIKEIQSRLSQVDKRLANIEIRQVERLKQTLAGKTKWLMEE